VTNGPNIFQMLLLHKLLFGTVDTDVPALFVVNNVDTVTRGYSFKLFVQQSRTDARKYSFSNRVIQICNRPSVTSDDFSSLTCF